MDRFGVTFTPGLLWDGPATIKKMGGISIKFTPGLFWVLAYMLTGPFAHIMITNLINHDQGFKNHEGHLVLFCFLAEAAFVYFGYKIAGLFNQTSGKKNWSRSTLPVTDFRQRCFIVKIGFLAVVNTILMRMVCRYLSVVSIANLVTNLLPISMYFIAVRSGVDRFDKRIFGTILLACFGGLILTSAHNGKFDRDKYYGFGLLVCLIGMIFASHRWVKVQEISLTSKLPLSNYQIILPSFGGLQKAKL